MDRMCRDACVITHSSGQLHRAGEERMWIWNQADINGLYLQADSGAAERLKKYEEKKMNRKK